MPCPARKYKPSAVAAAEAHAMPEVGAQGLLKLKLASTDPADQRDVYGEVTNKPYAFSIRKILYVDTRDAVYLLGKDFVLA